MLSSRQNQHSNLSPASPEGEELKPPSPAEGPPNTTIYTLNESRSTFNVGFGGGAAGGGGEQPQKNTLSFRRGLSGHADYYVNQGEVSGHADHGAHQRLKFLNLEVAALLQHHQLDQDLLYVCTIIYQTLTLWLAKPYQFLIQH